MVRRVHRQLKIINDKHHKREREREREIVSGFSTNHKIKQATVNSSTTLHYWEKCDCSCISALIFNLKYSLKM